MTDMVVSGFRIYAVTFLVMGYDVISSMYFTSCGGAKSSSLISALRGIALLLGFTLILLPFVPLYSLKIRIFISVFQIVFFELRILAHTDHGFFAVYHIDILPVKGTYRIKVDQK